MTPHAGGLSPHKKLRSGASVWTVRRKPGVPHQRLLRDRSTDVLIIGAGISGALVADSLSAAGLRVIIVDRRSPMAGSTSASTALLQYELDTPLTVLARSLGLSKAQQIWRRSRLALEALRDRTVRLGIQADVQRRDSLYLAGDLLDARGLAREQDARRRAGFEVGLLTARELRETYGIRRQAALLGYDDLVADPRALAAGFLRAAVGRGAALFCPVDVAEIHETASRVVAGTTSGREIRARHVVFATGYELVKGVPARGHSVESTWAIATRPQRSKLWPTECTIWEASEPYLYLRTTPDGRIVCGGEDEPFQDEAARDALSPKKFSTLEARLKALLPWVDARSEFQWSGCFGASETGTPSIGRIPGRPRSLAVLGYGGNGITFSMLASQIVRGIVTGAGDPDERLFALRR